MLKQINPDARPVFADSDLDALLAHDLVQGYLRTLDEVLVLNDLTIDRALAIGFLVVREARAGRLDEHLAIGAKTFDADEFADLAAAALAFLLPLVQEGLRAQGAPTPSAA